MLTPTETRPADTAEAATELAQALQHIETLRHRYPYDDQADDST